MEVILELARPPLEDSCGSNALPVNATNGQHHPGRRVKTITLPFWPEDHVKIKPLENIEGRVVEIMVCTDHRLEIKVKYYHNGEGKAQYFFEDELELVCKKTN